MNMMDKLIQVMKDNYTIPKILLTNYKKMNIDEKTLIVLIYLMNDKTFKFNPRQISEDLCLSMSEVLQIMDSLATSDIVSIELKKVNDIREEFINLDNLYTKLAYFMVNEEEVETKVKENSSNIYDIFEQEFGRTLSPIEYELINGWIDAGFKEDIIVMALKEAIFNGVSNLRYIDRILYEWKKKGLNSKEAIENNRINFEQKKIEKKELFDYDWLNDVE